MDCSLQFAEDCPGRFCGRQLSAVVNASAVGGGSCYSECGACPSGYRILNGSSECVKCDGEAGLRDYLYLGFYCIVSIAVRLSLVRLSNIGKQSSLVKLLIAISTVLENGIAMILTLLVLHPQGSLNFYSCPVETVTDFYPIFFDPSLDYVHHIRCTYEVVYPLYTMVFIFFGFCLAVHLLALSWLAPLMWKFKDSFNYNSELFWLIALPVLIVIHAILPGLIYYSFEYVTIISSLVVFVVATTIIQITTYGFKNTFRVYGSPDYWFFTCACMFVYAYGIISLTDSSSVEFRAKLLLIVLAPPLLHPILSYFASPQTFLTAFHVDSYNEFYQY